MEALLRQLVLGGSQVATTVRETPAFADRGFDATTITAIAQPRGPRGAPSPLFPLEAVHLDHLSETHHPH
ncbi:MULTISPECIES: hypothetical protein [unclassified Streptomyces]|uniref:hypothetical protein n=1 Tax=unclassified Streptomyces TaxID=2593676 RepID=UPI000B86BC19|nr:hypothetical protein [Streptomyces sp. MnatMP-M77]MYT83042.1 hypothetical protein [Streptomyces sp. SID8364]